MDEREFEERLQAMHDRVLSKALSQEEESNYTESLFESIRRVNEYGQEIPIFLTKSGKDIIDEIGIPDGLIYYGRTGIFAFTNVILNVVKNGKR